MHKAVYLWNIEVLTNPQVYENGFIDVKPSQGIVEVMQGVSGMRRKLSEIEKVEERAHSLD